MRRRWTAIGGVLLAFVVVSVIVYYRNALAVIPAIDRPLFPAP